MRRKTRAGVTQAFAGCFECGGAGYDVRWQGKNAVGVAARHHDATGHATWAEQTISIWYGERLTEGDHHDDTD